MSGDHERETELLRVRYERERRIRREAEAIAEKATARLYEADRLKTAFLKTISHELRTPLTAVTGFSDVLARQWAVLDDARRLEFLERIRRNGMILRARIEEILDLTRLDSGATSPPEPLFLSRVVLDALDELAEVLGNRPVRRAVEPDVWALADETAVKRILGNLLVNAVRYTPEGTAVDVAVSTRDHRAVLVVADEGPGIPPDERAAVFERFYRGKQDVVLRTPGSGIGLALVKELTERMGGCVELDDAEGGGARFSVSLPSAEAR
jgi:signal transduction histidine kinase